MLPRQKLICAFLVFLFSASLAAGQVTQDALNTEMAGNIYLLRGFYGGDHLSFDSTGQPKKPYKAAPLLTCGMKIESVHLSNTRLLIEGRRVGFSVSGSPSHYDPTAKQFIPIEISDIEISIDRRVNDDTGLNTAIQRVLAKGFDSELIQSVPELWQQFFESADRLEAARAKARKERDQYGAEPVTAPAILSTANPRYPELALRNAIGGKVVMELVIDTSGKPTHVRMIQPIGFGLDEECMAALEKYRFKPAMYHGKAVPTDISIEMNIPSR